MNEIKPIIKNTLFKYSLFLPLTVCLIACTGFNIFSVLLSTIAACIFFRYDNETDIFPLLFLFVISTFSLNTIGFAFTLICFVISGGIICLTAKSGKTFSGSLNRSVLTLASALVITILVTNFYFGIGATGATVIQMIKSYRSLGFHPNWRGILYGTIVMIIMITFPREFKKVFKVIKASLAALIFIYILNMVLIPKSIVSTVDFIGYKKFELLSYDGISADNRLTFSAFCTMVLVIISLWVCFRLSDGSDKISRNESAVSGISVITSAVMFGLAIPGRPSKEKNSIISGAAASVLIVLSMLIFRNFERMPVSACAVMLIVSVWQNLDKKSIKDVFRHKINIPFFFACIIIFILVNPAAGTLAALMSSFITEKIQKRAISR